MTIYLDNAATTRVVPSVAAVIDDCMLRDYGNPSSAHHMGIDAEKRIKAARDLVLAAIGDTGGRLGELYWTSGGTEGDALAVIGAARARARGGGRILVSAVEHSAVRESAAMLADEGFTVDEMGVDGDGVVEPEAAAALVGDDTRVAALMLVNNEIGTVQPVAELTRAIRARNREVHVHCDAVQGLGKVPIDAGALGVDSIAFAAHKLHGPKGVGALWVRKGARLRPLWAGGGQQGGTRSGTLNVPGIAGMGEAVRLAVEGLAERQARWRGLGEILLAAARDSGVPVRLNGAAAPRSAHVLSLAFRGIPAEPLLHVLESRGVLVSAGSACSERSRKPSPVLSAIGLGRDWGTIRFSFGRETTEQEVREAAAILTGALRDF